MSNADMTAVPTISRQAGVMPLEDLPSAAECVCVMHRPRSKDHCLGIAVLVAGVDLSVSISNHVPTERSQTQELRTVHLAGQSHSRLSPGPYPDAGCGGAAGRRAVVGAAHVLSIARRARRCI